VLELFAGLVGVGVVLGVVYALIQVAGSTASGRAKAIWVAAILLLPGVGLVAWVLAGPRGLRY